MLVDVQVHIGAAGNGVFNIVGLADKAVAENRERARAARLRWRRTCRQGAYRRGFVLSQDSASVSPAFG
jgi:hypothetical protein